MRENQIARHWKLLLHLYALHYGATVEDFADLLGCTVRTVYRDLEALEVAGFPIYVDKTDLGTKYCLTEEYKTKLKVVFSPMELMAVTMATQACNFLEGTIFGEALETARGKVSASLTDKHKSYANTIQSSFQVSFRPVHNYAKFHDVIEAVTHSILEKHALKISYWSAGKREDTERLIEPYRLWYVNNALYVVAYCRMRKDVRTFLIDRIRAWEKTESTYEIPSDFNFERFQARSFKVLGGAEEQEVVVRVNPLLRPQMTEQTWHPTQKVEELKNGWLRVSFRLAAVDEIKTWIMGYAPFIIVEKPDDLRRNIEKTLHSALDAY